MFKIYSNITVRARLGVLLRTIEALLPSQNKNLPQCMGSHRLPSLKEQRFERRGGYVCVLPNGYEVVRGTIVVITVDEYALKSAYSEEKMCWP